MIQTVNIESAVWHHLDPLGTVWNISDSHVNFENIFLCHNPKSLPVLSAVITQLVEAQPRALVPEADSPQRYAQLQS